jgi:hypothetical protein
MLIKKKGHANKNYSIVLEIGWTLNLRCGKNAAMKQKNAWNGYTNDNHMVKLHLLSQNQ